MAFKEIAEVLQRFTHSTLDTNSIEKYKINTMTAEVYPVEGGYEDFVYAASWENEVNQNSKPIKTCRPVKGSKKEFTESVNGANLVYLVETYDSKHPEEKTYGSDDNLTDAKGRFYGNVTRNVRLNLMVLDYLQPYALIEIEENNVFVSFRGCVTLDSVSISFVPIKGMSDLFQTTGKEQQVEVKGAECFGKRFERYNLKDLTNIIDLPVEYKARVMFSADKSWLNKNENDLSAKPQLYLNKLKNGDNTIENDDYYYEGRGIYTSYEIIKLKDIYGVLDDDLIGLIGDEVTVSQLIELTPIQVDWRHKVDQAFASKWLFSLNFTFSSGTNCNHRAELWFVILERYSKNEKLTSDVLTCLSNEGNCICSTEFVNRSTAQLWIGGLLRIADIGINGLIVGNRTGSFLGEQSACVGRDFSRKYSFVRKSQLVYDRIEALTLEKVEERIRNVEVAGVFNGTCSLINEKIYEQFKKEIVSEIETQNFYYLILLVLLILIVIGVIVVIQRKKKEAILKDREPVREIEMYE